MPDIKAAVVAADEETNPTVSTDVLMLINAAGTTFKKIKLQTLFSAIDALVYKGVIDCSANPNYPAADAGHVYKVSVAGKIGGGSGPNVEVGDTLICAVDSSASGNHATVGANWGIIQNNLDFGSSVATQLGLAANGSDDEAIGFRGIPPNSQAVDYTLVLADSGKHIYETGAGKTVTIPANASVAFPIGTTVTFIATDTGGCSIAITSDTLRWAEDGTTGTRTLAQYGIATAIKITSTEWLISGTGLS